ncbi:beta-ketoacyl-[acyl-carrier-protein] synthase family protein [Aquimarina sp. 2201CG14-23]|uniref:beta-ketoacyl-[acyl-carrier-protein] synthase family protein n=1 Tax=Aquimarina mycalae TaxID=3040073 RepID=UPI0024782BCF|nr:beta-ketoacyl-[acyl-carrier-protein] synthase family protein [Aquimarina sp. 2201CG14-23]MDH7446738.1 beta-ketoacyl-[acyl-carrier-protein] synthase family protein [Aquimarina sp. 2201CG14-23]
MDKGIAITGMGIISSIGNSVDENLNALKSVSHGISRIEMLKTRHSDQIMVGEIKKTNSDLEKQLGLEPLHSFSRTAMIGAIAAKEALQDAKISDISEYRTGFISGTSVGGMDTTEKYYLDYHDNEDNRRFIQAQHAGYTTQSISNYLGIKGYVSTISTACSSAANAIMLGARMIKAGKIDRMIVGGTDALSKFTINGFGTLMILSDEECTPFDDNRKGLNLGEAAAYLVLESDAIVKKENKKVLGRVAGWANANDAYHQTASSSDGEGAYLAMNKALEVANMKAEDVDYVNAHGTATPNNDLSEGVAMTRIFGEENPPVFSSTKAFTGHTLAAAGSVEAIYSLLSLRENLIFPNLNFKTQMKEFSLVPETALVSKEMNTILSNSFGFGGNCSTLIFTK